MIWRKLFISIFAFAILNSGYSQPTDYNIPLPQILPASPDASQFVKAGVGNVNMSTGAATANIPLYTIKVKDFSYPLSLSYSTQGLKADEASSRVGLGWVLNAGAMITRSVKDKPDEFSGRMIIPADFNAATDAVYNYCSFASDPNSGFDSQPDEFQFNCNGYTGKFILDNNMKAQITTTCNVKIDIDILVTPGSTAGHINLIKLTTPDGIKYTFGSNSERTTTHNIGFNNPYRAVTKTAFFLDRVDLPTGGYIVFNYTAINTRVITGTTQTLQLARVNGDQNCGSCTAHNTYTTQQDKVEYATSYLSSITTSNGLVINLTYELRPDLSYDNRLKTLEVTGLKKYIFNYYDVYDPALSPIAITGRFFLTKLQDVIDSSSSYDYTFTYDNMNSVPLPVTFLQDYLGYYSEGANSNYFIPPGLNSNNTIDFSFRNPVVASTKKGTLTAIQYPTGGTEEFTYDGNTTSTTALRNTMATYTLSGPGGGSSGSFVPVVYTNTTITVPKDQTVTLSASAADAILNDGYTADPAHVTVSVKVLEGTTLIGSRSVLGYTPSSGTFTLYAGHTYKLQMTVNAYTENGSCSLQYDSNPNIAPIYDTFNIPIPGVRLKQIKYTDPVTASTHSKYYTYAALSNLLASTGGLYKTVDFLSSPVVNSFCGDFGAFETDCVVDTWSSSSTSSVYNYAGSGSLIYYTNVIESDDPGFVNGGTEYIFNTNDDGGNQQPLLGEPVPYITTGQYPTLSGSVATTNVFNKDKAVIQSEVNTYEDLSFGSNEVASIYVRKRYAPWPSRPDRYDAFDVIKTHYDNDWIRLKSKTVNSYANGQTLTQSTRYTYKTPSNILVDSTITTDSKGAQLITQKKYPTVQTDGDVVPDADVLNSVNSQLIAKNMITPVIEETSYRNGALLEEKIVRYKDWFADNTILAPEIIRVKESPADALHDELVFNAYDIAGNASQLQKVNDMQVVYLWDQIHALPLCEVKNATQAQVAFCSFEVVANYGNWSLTSGTVNTAIAFTGNNSFTGTLTKTLSASGNYIISLWTNSVATVNGSAGTQVKTSNGWGQYQWNITNPTTITVAGTNMDDIRLYPQSALMTTYTYIPFVGVSSKSEPDGSVSFYEYDSYHRLKNIKDYQGNIVKNYQYNYAISCGANCVVLPMQTFTSYNTPSYPVGVFDINKGYIGTASNPAQYVTLWNSNTINQAKGVLSANSDSLHFNLTLATNASAPPVVYGLRYYQWDIFNPGTVQIATDSLSYVDWGDGTHLLVTQPRMKMIDTIPYTYVASYLRNDFMYYWIYFNHTYAAAPSRTITVFHNETTEMVNISADGSSITQSANIRGYYPEKVKGLGISAVGISSDMGIGNMNKLTELVHIHYAITQTDTSHHNRWQSLNQSHKVKWIKMYNQNGSDIISNLRVNFPNLLYLEAQTYKPDINETWGGTGFPNLYILAMGMPSPGLSTAEMDLILNKQAAANTITNGFMGFLPTPYRSAASNTAYNALIARGWNLSQIANP